MSYAVLVLNDDNFAPVNVSDDRLSHGFSLNEELTTLREWRLSPYASRTMAIGVVLSHLVRINPEALYATQMTPLLRDSEPNIPELTLDELKARELWAAARFYTMSEHTPIDVDYISAHFDAICLFLNHPLTPNSIIPASLNSLLCAASCPPSFIFNLTVPTAPALTFSLQLFLHTVNTKAQFVHTLGSKTLANPPYQVTSDVNALFWFHQAKTKCALASLNGLFDTSEGLSEEITIAVSSTLFTRHAQLGISPEALNLLQALRKVWPQARFVVVLGPGIFSFAPLESDATYLHTDQSRSAGNLAEHWCHKFNAMLQRHALTQAVLQGQANLSEAPRAIEVPYVEGVFFGQSYEDYRKLLGSVRLLVTEYSCEQLLAASCGTATLGLALDLDLEQPISREYFATYASFKLNQDNYFGANLNERDEKAYQEAYQSYDDLARVGQLNRGAKVGFYQELSPVSFGTSTIFPCLKLSELCAYPHDAIAKAQDALNAAAAQNDVALQLERPSALNAVWQQVLQDKAQHLHPQEQLTVLRHKLGLNAQDHCGARQLAQRANFTGSGRYEVQWQVLKSLLQSKAQHELTIMSFGCSTGQELAELRVRLGPQGQHRYLGVDLSEDALAQARQLWHNLEQLPALPQAQSASFITTAQLEDLVNVQHLQCDVICAMTVLCRYPETAQLENAQGVYDWVDFAATLQLLDQALKPGGLLCLFNTNYALEDSELSAHYQRLFPAQERQELVQLLASSEGLASAFERAAQQGPQSLTAALFGYVPTFAPTGERLAVANKGTIFRKLS